MLKICNFHQVSWSNSFLLYALVGEQGITALISNESCPQLQGIHLLNPPYEHMRTLALWRQFTRWSHSIADICCCWVEKSYDGVWVCWSVHVSLWPLPLLMIIAMHFICLACRVLNATGSLNIFIAFFGPGPTGAQKRCPNPNLNSFTNVLPGRGFAANLPGNRSWKWQWSEFRGA